MKYLNIKAFSDSGHGWAKVERKTLIDLRILHDISNYSYQRGGYVYLEEDQDLTLFVNAMKARFEGIELNFKSSHTDYRSKIRSYDSFHLTNEEKNKIEFRKQLKTISHRIERGFEINRANYDFINEAIKEFLKY